MDYYSSSFAIQVLQLMYAKLAGDSDPRSAEFKSRAQQMALDLAHYYDDTGRAIPYGRSMGYRFAMVAFWGSLAHAGVDLPAPLTWGMVKGIVLRNFRWWQTQPKMWSSSGTMTLGYSYPNMYLTENYNSPGSPYWACLAFICLATPVDHPFWTSEEESHWGVIPAIKALPQPGHIMSNLGGHCMLLSSGQACGYPMKGTHGKYGAFAYSSAYGYSVPTGLLTLEQYALASQLGLSDDGGESWKMRRKCEYAAIEYRDDKPVLISVWRPFSDVKITTFLLPPEEATPNWHIRAHKIEAGRDIMTADGSFAIRNADSQTGRIMGPYDPERGEGTLPRIIGNYDTASPEGWAPGTDGAVAVSAGAVGIKALDAGERRANLVNADPNSNLVESRTVIPTLQGTVKKGEVARYVSGVYARPDGEGVERAMFLDAWASPPRVPGWVVSALGL